MSKAYPEYYQDELDALHDLSDEFAEEYADIASALRLKNRDPDVERLLQGTAFLTGRIRQLLDAEYPQLLYPLLHQIWPHALRPIPSMGVVQFDAKRAESMQSGAVVPPHSEIHSRPVTVDGQQCRFTFRTCYELHVLPMVLEQVLVEQNELRLRLRLQPRASLFRLLPGDSRRRPALRLSLHGSLRQAYGLYWGLSRSRGLRLRLPQLDIAVSSERDPEHVALRPLGWAPQETLLPYPPHSFAGHRHLHEYFIFPKKYLFFDVYGLDMLAMAVAERAGDAAQTVGKLREIEVCISLGEARGHDLTLTTDDNPIRLNCVPVANLYEHDAAQIRVDYTRPEFLLRPHGIADHCDIFAVNEVVADTGGFGQLMPQVVPSFDSYGADSGPVNLMYQLRPRPPISGRKRDYRAAQCYLAFVTPNGEPLLPEKDTLISAKLLVTNRNLPRLSRANVVLSETTIDVPEGLSVRSVDEISDAAPSALGIDGAWRFLSMMLSGWHVAEDAESLQELLRLYALPALHSGQARLNLQRLCTAIQSLTSTCRPRLVGKPASLVFGTKLELRMADNAFDYPGQLLLFGNVLNHHFSGLAAINTFMHLELHTSALAAVDLPCLLGEQGTLSMQVSHE